MPTTITIFVRLKAWDQRTEADQSVFSLLQSINGRLQQEVSGSFAFGTNVPPVDGVGATGGFEFHLQNRAGQPIEMLVQNAQALIAAARERPELERVSTTFTPATEQISITPDRDLIQALDVDVNEAFGTLEAYLGGKYVNDFILGADQYRVYVQAEGSQRRQPGDIGSFFVRSRSGELLQLQNVIKTEPYIAPPTITAYNVTSL